MTAPWEWIDEEKATAFDFYQAVRLLERLRPDRKPVGGFVDPAEEVVRFAANPRPGFPASDIAALSLPAEGPAEMVVNFMGLVGPSGVLPHEYTTLVLQRLRLRDGASAAFLDLFHHRLVSFLYRAWKKHRFTVSAGEGDDRLRGHALDLAGAGVEAGRRSLPLPDDALAFQAGLLALGRPTAGSLERLVEEYLGVPTAVEQFAGRWYRLPPSDLCTVGEGDGESVQLGAGAVVGDAVWDPQARVRLRLGPLTRDQFDRLLPTGDAHGVLRALVRFFAHDGYDFELQLVLARDEVHGCRLGDDGPPQPLGWSTWIRSAAFGRDADDTILPLAQLP